MTVDAIANLLREAIADSRRLRATIAEVQRLVWAEKVDGTEKEKAVLADLALDLDYFEPDPAARKEDASFFGEERAISEIRAALEKLRLS